MKFTTKVSKLWDNYNKNPQIMTKLGKIMANYHILRQNYDKNTNYIKNNKSNFQTVESQLCLIIHVCIEYSLW